MERDGSFQYEIAVDLGPQPLAGTSASVWGQVTGEIRGRADPATAARTFGATGDSSDGALAAAVREHVTGWVSWAVGEVFRRSCAQGALGAWLPDASGAADQVLAELSPRFAQWACDVERMALAFAPAAECLPALPPELRGATQAASVETVDHVFSGDIPPVQDPASGNTIRVRCQVSVTFRIDLEVARPAVDPAGTYVQERVVREVVARAEEWFWYGVKQAFYNWVCDTARPHRRFVRDYGLIHPEVMALCEQGLAGLGVSVTQAQVRYEAQDPDSAWALTAPGQSGRSPVVSPTGAPATAAEAPRAPASGGPSSGQHRITPTDPSLRADSEQAMAATIAVMNVDDLPEIARSAAGAPPATGGGQGAALPPIEEAAWRHQKRILREQPGLDRAALAPLVLERLRADGYPLDERKRIAGVIGGDPSAVPE